MASVKSPSTRPSSRSSSRLRGRSQDEEPEIFKRLWSIDWHHQPQNGATFTSDLNAKRHDGSTIIQTLLELDAPQNAVDEAVMGIIDQTDIKYLDVTGRDHETALYTAVRKERPNVARKLLDKGCDVTIRNHQERVPVHVAAINGNVGLVTSLLEKDPTLINTQDGQRLTPLDAACWQGKVGVVNFILSRDKGALQLTDNTGKTPLMTAVDQGHLDCCQALLDTEEGMRILNAGDDGGVTALDTACIKGNYEIVNFLLDKGAYKECRDAKGFTPFLTAATNGHGIIVEKLVHSGCDMAARTNNGSTAMTRAAFYGHEDVIKLLLRYESGRELLNVGSGGGVTPLIMASRYDRINVIPTLLANGADQFRCDEYGNTALMGASKWRYPSIVRMLLQHACMLPDDSLGRLLNHKSSREAAAVTALHNAAYYGHVEIIEILLEYGADVDAVDSQKLNALHYACRQGYLELAKMLYERTSDVNAVDEDGWTALHQAASAEYDKARELSESDLGPGSAVCTPGRHVEIINHLLQQPGVDPITVTSESETALHMACGRGFHSRVEALLGDPRVRIALPWENQHGRTPLGTAMSRQKLQVLRLLLSYVDPIEFGHTDDDYEDPMMWLATWTETHDDLRTILLAGINTDMATFKSWGALELAAYRGFPKLLWSLLHSTDPTPGRNERMRSMRPIVMNTISRLQSEGGGDTKEGFTVGRESKQELAMDPADVSNKDPRFETLLKYEKVIRILQSPPMVDMARRKGVREDENDRSKPTYGSHSTQMLDSYSACIVELYQADPHHHDHLTGRTGSSIRSDVHVRFDTIGDLIYGLSPDELLDKARKGAQNIEMELGRGDTLGSESLTKEAVQIRWFHLPANNMKWMKDLALALMEDSAIEDGGLSWLDHSWNQVMGQSPWRFMKPKCAYRMTPGDKMTQMALYMPYLNLGIHDALPTPQRKMYEDLLKDYTAKVIHGSHTLDEFYYHSCEEQGLRLDVLSRNEDQVLSKTIHGPIKNLSWWALVNVDQIWVWVIDEKTIISSSTHRMDLVDDPLITAVLDNLRQAHGTGHGRGSPTSSFQMAGQIVDTCVGFYERQLKLNLKHSGESYKLPRANALKESSLYSRFASHERTKHSGQAPGIQAAAHGKRREILEAANLFREIKDIRDEVKMLKTVVEYQTQVQLDFNRANGKGLSGGSGMTSSEGIINRLKEMDKAAARIEMAVSMRVSLLSWYEDTDESGFVLGQHDTYSGAE
ncbi:hypothetical protein N3K66_007814 [Trichothecium roseum]|uniref:Uncharacterized protein n=1 Tax=Trichothecium roseum TaxID=47278 RepID=A0ACC0UU83_9HYPO|nr:hypothetical protein N3K66_007814 [Trichothecium roseum]